MQNCAHDNDAARALQVYEQMKSEGVNVAPYIYNVVINVCSRMEDLAAFKSGAYAVYQDMKEACDNAKQQQQKGKKKHQQQQVPEPIYSAMVKICSKAQDFEACETLIAEMEEAKVEPKLRTFGLLLQAHSDAGHLDKCIWVHDKFLKTSWSRRRPTTWHCCARASRPATPSASTPSWTGSLTTFGSPV